MPRLLVIGYGNTLRGDDGFGPLAAGLIAEAQLPDVAVVVCHQLGPEHAAALSEAEEALFLDATETGTNGALAAAAVEPRNLSGIATHRLDPGVVLGLARAVYGKTPAATLVTAAAASFDHGAPISDAVRAAAHEAAALIVSLAASGRLTAAAVRTAMNAKR